ncbi:hypothetical protein V9T40_010950 [Parthenolecanium corni]|uniref:Uncharacterized protein n=1 Tax=Parthenolecanium corni TaxID=536013 RepID=A0AAN9T820_9HEMI
MVSYTTPLKILRWTTQRNNILRNPDFVSFDATCSLEVILVASYMTPPGPLSNLVEPGFSSVNPSKTRWRRIRRRFNFGCAIPQRTRWRHICHSPVL